MKRARANSRQLYLFIGIFSSDLTARHGTLPKRAFTFGSTHVGNDSLLILLLFGFFCGHHGLCLRLLGGHDEGSRLGCRRGGGCRDGSPRQRSRAVFVWISRSSNLVLVEPYLKSLFKRLARNPGP